MSQCIFKDKGNSITIKENEQIMHKGEIALHFYNIHKILYKPIANPSAADLPLPRPAVRVTVVRSVFSVIATTNWSTALA